MSKKLVKISKNMRFLSTFFAPPCANDAIWRSWVANCISYCGIWNFGLAGIAGLGGGFG